jgi:hypothetical protein
VIGLHVELVPGATRGPLPAFDDRTAEEVMVVAMRTVAALVEGRRQPTEMDRTADGLRLSRAVVSRGHNVPPDRLLCHNGDLGQSGTMR